jgi:hypothetical protein
VWLTEFRGVRARSSRYGNELLLLCYSNFLLARSRLCFDKFPVSQCAHVCVLMTYVFNFEAACNCFSLAVLVTKLTSAVQNCHQKMLSAQKRSVVNRSICELYIRAPITTVAITIQILGKKGMAFSDGHVYVLQPQPQEVLTVHPAPPPQLPAGYVAPTLTRTSSQSSSRLADRTSKMPAGPVLVNSPASETTKVGDNV